MSKTGHLTNNPPRPTRAFSFQLTKNALTVEVKCISYSNMLFKEPRRSHANKTLREIVSASAHLQSEAQDFADCDLSSVRVCWSKTGKQLGYGIGKVG
jgi:hypothetical protein